MEFFYHALYVIYVCICSSKTKNILNYLLNKFYKYEDISIGCKLRVGLIVILESIFNIFTF